MNVRFSNRPFGVKHFQTVHCCSVDVTHDSPVAADRVGASLSLIAGPAKTSVLERMKDTAAWWALRRHDRSPARADCAHTAGLISATAARWREKPTTLAASKSDGGLGTKITFDRVIVYPDGHRHIEGVML
jgi:hypothetical protein